jgi:AcrR family transcriptional regulator
VSCRAGVSIGAIYARLGSRENLLRAVHQHATEALRAEHDALSAGAAGGDSRAAIVDAVRTVAGIFRGSGRLLRAFVHLGAADEEISRPGSASSPDLAPRFAAAVLFAPRDRARGPGDGCRRRVPHGLLHVRAAGDVRADGLPPRTWLTRRGRSCISLESEPRFQS